MDSPSIAMANAPPLLQAPRTPCINGRRSSTTTPSPSTSPEFEFWRVRNPSLAPPNILSVSADELFVRGVMLPLRRLSLTHNDPPDTAEPPPPSRNSVDAGTSANPDSDLRSGLEITSEPTSSSKRWMDIFKKSGGSTRSEEKVKIRKAKESRGRNASGSPELNINIWPFTRSSSDGMCRTRPGIPVGSPATRKTSSAPCSRSNSAGDSKTRVKWPSSPGRVGVHVGRSSPVLQARRGGGAAGSGGTDTVIRSAPKIVKKKKKKGYSAQNEAKRINLNVPTCIGYRSSLGCRREETGPGGVRAGSGRIDGRGVSNTSGGGGNLFNIRNIFTKKVY